MAEISKKRGKKSKTKKTLKRKSKTSKTRISSPKRYESKIDAALIDNFITLQKIMVNFSAKFDVLSNQISKLLELFEISAKSLARKDLETEKENKDTKKILEKLDTLSQQSGLIGRGLALIHEIGSGKKPSAMPEQRRPIPMRKPILPPRRPPPGMQGYQRSIASQNSESKSSKPVTKEISR